MVRQFQRNSASAFLGVLLFVLLVGDFSIAKADTNNPNEGFWCWMLGFIAVPLGFCEAENPVSLSPEVPVSKPEQDTSPEAVPVPEILSDSDTIPAPIYQTDVTNVYEGLTESEVIALIDQKLSEASLGTLAVEHSGSAIQYDEKALAQAVSLMRRNIENAREDGNEDVSEVEELITNLETGGTFAQATFSGETTFDNALYLGASSPSDTTNRLYNIGGDLYWDGALVGGTASSTWSTNGSDTYQVSGNIGIGTSTPSSKLTVSGVATFAGSTGTTTIEHALSVIGRVALGTTTGEILDMGGSVCNVRAYGAVGDNSSDNYAAIMAAINDCPEGGIVLFPMGVFRISQPITLDKPITLQGTYAPRWYYASTPRSSIKPTTSFVGSAIIHVRDQSISGEAAANNGGRITNINIDGNSFGTDVDGVYFEGLVRDWKVVDVDISQTSGNGFRTGVGGGSGNPRGFTVTGLSIYSPALHGVRATALTDSYFEDVLVVGGAQRGFYFTSMGETKVANSRAVFNALEGLYIDGASTNGGFQFTDFSTDRNDRHGVRISATGTTTISFNGLLTRRDGANDGGGTETPYAGVAIIGSSSAHVAPVVITNLTQLPGVDDDGLGTPSPDVGLRVEKATYVKVDGALWGITDPYTDGGENGDFIIAEDALLKTGYSTVTEELYNQKWVATSTNLHYTGSIGIGTTSPTSKLSVVGTDAAASVLTLAGTTSQSADYFRIKSTYDQTVGNIFTIDSSGNVGIGTTTMNRKLNIADATSPGFRFTDTTNNASIDMRVEDTQAFIGTMSNHDLRFITNGTSRAALTTGGRFGIGSTTPWRTLSVVGTVGFDGLSVATSSGDAICLFNKELVINTGAQTCTVSSARFKNSIADFTPEEAALLAEKLSPVTFEYNGTNEERIGLIAEEVSKVDDRLIFTEEDGTPRGVRYEDLGAVLLGAFKHQQMQIAALMGSTTHAIANAVEATFNSIFAETITVDNLKARTIEAEEDIIAGKKMCIDGVCMSGAELRALLENAGISPSEENNEESEETKTGTSTASTTPETAEESEKPLEAEPADPEGEEAIQPADEPVPEETPAL